MKKNELAHALRRRYLSSMPDAVYKAMGITADDVITFFCTCHDCGKQHLSGVDLDNAIVEAMSVDEFLRLAGMTVGKGR